MEREMCGYLDWELNINGSILGSFKDRNTVATVRQVRRRDGLKTFHAHRSFFRRYPTTRSSHHDECHPQLWQFTKSCSIQPPQPPHIFLHRHGILPQHRKPLLPVIQTQPHPRRPRNRSHHLEQRTSPQEFTVTTNPHSLCASRIYQTYNCSRARCSRCYVCLYI